MRLCFLPLLAACYGSEPTAFPGGLEPLSDNDASWPSDTSSRSLDMVTAQLDDYSTAHARGYAPGSLDEVYAAVSTVEVCVDRREVDDWQVTEDTEPDYDVSFIISNTVNDLITVEYDVTWRHGPTEADEDNVITTYGSRWQKTEGSTVIEILRGSIQLSEVESGIVGLEYIEELGSIQPDDDASRAAQYIEDHYADVLATLAGESLEDFE